LRIDGLYVVNRTMEYEIEKVKRER
jgi:hypothetical protein